MARIAIVTLLALFVVDFYAHRALSSIILRERTPVISGRFARSGDCAAQITQLVFAMSGLNKRSVWEDHGFEATIQDIPNDNCKEGSWVYGRVVDEQYLRQLRANLTKEIADARRDPSLSALRYLALAPPSIKPETFLERVRSILQHLSLKDRETGLVPFLRCDYSLLRPATIGFVAADYAYVIHQRLKGREVEFRDKLMTRIEECGARGEIEAYIRKVRATSPHLPVIYM